MPEFQSVMPVLRVTDLDQAVQFYTSVLGFELAWRASQDGGGENAMLAAGKTNLLLSTGAHLGERPSMSGTLYFQTPGVADYFESLRTRVEVVWPLERMDYGTLEFGIRDPDGYLLAFAEPAGGDTTSHEQ